MENGLKLAAEHDAFDVVQDVTDLRHIESFGLQFDHMRQENQPADVECSESEEKRHRLRRSQSMKTISLGFKD